MSKIKEGIIINNEEEIHSNLKWIAKSGFWIFIGLIISKILFYVYRTIIAHNLGVEAYGLFSIAITVVSLFAVVGTFGMDSGVLRYVAYYKAKNQKSKIRSIVIDSLQVGLPLSIVMGMIMYLSSPYIATNIFHDQQLIALLKIFSFTLPIAFLVNIMLAYLQANKKVLVSSTINNIIHNIIRNILLIGFIYFGFQIKSTGYSYLISYILILFLLFYYCKYKSLLLLSIKSKIKHNKKEIIHYSWPLLFSSVITLLYGWIDTYIIGYYMGPYSVGLYNAALPIAMLMTLFPSIIIQILMPIIIKLYTLNDLESINIISKQVTKWLIFINLPLFALIVLFPRAFLNLLFGKEFIIASTALIFLASGHFLSCFWMIPYYSLQVIKKTRINLKIVGVSVILNFILVLILVPQIGINGAAIATLIAISAYTIMSIFFGYKYLKIIPFDIKVYKGIIAGIISTFWLLITKKYMPINLFSVIAMGIIFLIIYGFILLKLKAYDKKDIILVEAIENKTKIPIKKYLKYLI